MKIALLILFIGVCNAARITNWDEFDKFSENIELGSANANKQFEEAVEEFIEREQEYDDTEEQFFDEQEYDDKEEQFGDIETNSTDEEQQVAAENEKVADAQKYIASLGLQSGTVGDNNQFSTDPRGRFDSFNYSIDSNLVSQNVTH